MSAKKQNKKSNPKGSRVTQRKHASHSPKSKATLGKVASKQRKKAIERTKPTLWEFTLHILYKQLYFLGITILRRKLRYTRKLKRGFILVKGRTYSVFERVLAVIFVFFRNLVKRVKTPFQRILTINAEVKPIIAAAKVEGTIPFSSYWRIAASVLRLFSTIIITMVNYAAPVIAAIFLISVIQMYINQPLALEVEYNGEIIGYVKTESEFEQAAQTLRDRFIDGSTTVEMPYYRLVAVTPEDYQYGDSFLERFLFLERKDVDYTTAGELADKMVQASGDSIEWAYGFYVDNQFHGAVVERGYITTELEKITKSNSTGAPDERVEFTKSISVREGLYPTESIIPTDSMGKLIHSNETVDEVYEVVEDDSPTGIAEKNGIPYSQLLELNPGIEDNLAIGQDVFLAVARPFLSVKNIYTAVYEETYPYDTEEVESATYHIGYRNVLEEGENGIREVTAEVTTINGIETDRIVLSTRTISEPKTEKVMVGTTDPQQIPSQNTTNTDMTPSGSSGGFIWPTRGGYINGGVGSYAGHTGVDIPRDPGTPIYASRGGTVVKVERSWVNYGHHVIVDHGDGYQTLYAHASELYVSVGQQVSQGEVIAAVGRTGRATGNHLHFEVRYQGRIQIPQNFIGYGP